jgi:hypothetical protein
MHFLAGSPPIRQRLLLTGLILRRVRLVGVGLVGFVMADRTTGRRAELAVPCHVAGNSTYYRTLDASLGVGRWYRASYDRGRKDGCKHPFHDCSPNMKFEGSIRCGERKFQAGRIF